MTLKNRSIALSFREFQISKYPTTNAQYKAFIDGSKVRIPSHWKRDGFPGRLAAHPVVNVTWHDALEYCCWVTEQLRAIGQLRDSEVIRLPTEAEWEKAACWDDEKKLRRIWPWARSGIETGAIPLKGETVQLRPWKVQLPAGDSYYGLADVSGNVLEWCTRLSSVIRTTPRMGGGPAGVGMRVLRGGSWNNPYIFARCGYPRAGERPDSCSGLVGSVWHCLGDRKLGCRVRFHNSQACRGVEGEVCPLCLLFLGFATSAACVDLCPRNIHRCGNAETTALVIRSNVTCEGPDELDTRFLRDYTCEGCANGLTLGNDLTTTGSENEYVTGINDTAINAHYGRQGLGQAILDALAAAGKNVDALTVDDLAPIDEFHMRGKITRRPTSRASRLYAACKCSNVGGGLGGPARVLAAEFGCTGDRLGHDEKDCQVGEMLTGKMFMGDSVTFKQGNAVEIPFADESYDIVWMQAVAVNIRDKRRLFSEIHRVLRPTWPVRHVQVMAGKVMMPFLRPSAYRTVNERDRNGGYDARHSS